MSRDTAAAITPGVDEAMNRVLREEAQARVAVEACRERAKALLEEAQGKAKRIEHRADARLLRIHWLADRALQRALQRLAESGPRPGAASLPAGEGDRLVRVIERMLDEMVGGEP